MNNRLKNCLLILLIGVPAFCLSLIALSALSNLGLPDASQNVAVLAEAEQIRLAEALHLRRALGDAVWPGYGSAEIPLLPYNEGYAFLVGLPDPADGWEKPGDETTYGAQWEQAAGPFLDGLPYFRQPVANGGDRIGAFTVRVGETWVAAFPTREWGRIALRQEVRDTFPAPLAWMIPYRVVDSVLVDSTEWYLSVTFHESFHAYQGQIAPQRLLAAERAIENGERIYPWEDPLLIAAWQIELDLLADALQAQDPAQISAFAADFLRQRAARRQDLQRSPDLVAYEQQREWVEGLAKYIELQLWKAAAVTPAYQPLPRTTVLPDFHDYRNFDRRWDQEVAQIRRMAGDQGDGRFYYSGMAQAVLLDHLLPGWKDQFLTGELWLDDLLSQALDP